MTASVEQNPVTRNDMTPYKTAFIVFGVTGTLSNGLVLLGFWLSGRSRMSSSSLHVTNHTTLEHSPFSDLSIFLTSTVRGLLFLVLTRPVFPWKQPTWAITRDSQTVSVKFELVGLGGSHFLDLRAQTTLELLACVMITVRFSLDLAGVFRNFDYSSSTATVFCVLLYSSTLMTLGLNGGTACLVIITLDRYWKIVHPIHYRNYYRRWMLYFGLFLPWLNGVATHMIPAVLTTSIVDEMCVTTAFRAKVFSSMVYIINHC